MQININSVRFKADKQLENFITDKLQKIGKFHEGVIGSDVTLKVDNTDKPENKIAEIRLKVRGNDLISTKQCKTFEEATDSAIEALRKQLKKVKEKQREFSPKDQIDTELESQTNTDLEDEELHTDEI